MNTSPDRRNLGESVTILMAMRNGAAHLPAQLDSFVAQTHPHWTLVASDDGSTDDSRAILNGFAREQAGRHRVETVDGPNQGFARNFLSLLARADLSGPVALSDQDDIWFPNRLTRALGQLSALPADRPALYCSRRMIWWPDQNHRHPSRAYPRAPGFGNALVENIAPGNTIVLNAAALALAQETAARAADVPFHDWWLYLLVSGVGGTVIHDPEPGLLYRQHGRNVVGQGEGFRAGLAVKQGVVQGRYANRISRNLAALNQIAEYLTPENRARLDLFQQARRAGPVRRLALMHRAGVYRQGLLARFSFWGVACFGRV